MTLSVPKPVMALLITTELRDLADLHERYATEALYEGNGELHDFHECRAFELRQTAVRAQAQAVTS